MLENVFPILPIAGLSRPETREYRQIKAELASLLMDELILNSKRNTPTYDITTKLTKQRDELGEEATSRNIRAVSVRVNEFERSGDVWTKMIELPVNGTFCKVTMITVTPKGKVLLGTVREKIDLIAPRFSELEERHLAATGTGIWERLRGPARE